MAPPNTRVCVGVCFSYSAVLLPFLFRDFFSWFLVWRQSVLVIAH